MVLKGSQIIDLATDGSGRAAQLPPVVGIQGKFIYIFSIFVLILPFYYLLFENRSLRWSTAGLRSSRAYALLASVDIW